MYWPVNSSNSSNKSNRFKQKKVNDILYILKQQKTNAEVNNHCYFSDLIPQGWQPQTHTMDPCKCGQDLIRCALCGDALASMHCNLCHMHLCNDCVAKHLSDKSQVHTVVLLTQYLSTLHCPKCSDHPNTQCELYCENCDCPICLQCVTSEKHKHHGFVHLSQG